MRSLLVSCLAAGLLGVVAPAATTAQPARAPPPVSSLPVSPLPGMAAPARTPSAPSAPAGTEAPVVDPGARVALRAVAVEGVTVYPPDSFAAATRGLAGRDVSVADIDAARLAVLRRYRDDGYALTAVTAIVEPDGLLRLRVTEGRIAEVRLDGDIGPAGAQVLRFLTPLIELKVIDVASLERALLLAGDVPGVSLAAILRASTENPGALTLVAQVSRNAFSGQISADNRAFANVGPIQLLGVLDANSFSEYGELTQLQLYRTPNGAQIFGQASLQAFLGGSGLRLRLTAGRGVSRPTGTFRLIDYTGTTTLAGVELAYPLIRARRQTLNLTAAAEAIEAEVRQSAAPTRDSLRVVRLGMDWAVSDTLAGDERGAVNGLTLRFAQGLSGLGASRPGDPLASRAGAEPAFRKLSFDASRNQTLLLIGEGSSLALQATLAGQWTRDALPPAEKFLLGGSRLARGFYYGQVTGDSALAASMELQLNGATELELFGDRREWSGQLYAFSDWGQTWETPKTDRGHVLRSVGVGLRITPGPRLETGIELVHRLTRYPAGGGPGVAALPATAVFWHVLARF